MPSLYTAPPTTLNPLANPDGSATHTAHGYTVTAAVNGPLEVSRRDELPEEAALEVNVRPAVGVGTPRDRHLETLLARTLRPVILARAFPRTLIQLTLQILRTPPRAPPGPFAHSTLLMMPALLGAAQLALLAANLPLATTLAPVLALTPASASSSSSPSAPLVLPLHSVLPLPPHVLARAAALHVFAFAGAGADEDEDGSDEGEDELLLAESEGDFALGEWEAAWAAARRRRLAGSDGGGRDREEDGDDDDDDEEEDMSIDEEEGGVRLDSGQKRPAAREWLARVVAGQG